MLRLDEFVLKICRKFMAHWHSSPQRKLFPSHKFFAPASCLKFSILNLSVVWFALYCNMFIVTDSTLDQAFLTNSVHFQYIFLSLVQWNTLLMTYKEKSSQIVYAIQRYQIFWLLLNFHFILCIKSPSSHILVSDAAVNSSWWHSLWCVGNNKYMHTTKFRDRLNT